jgi:SSS family solute:Na+ symporter
MSVILAYILPAGIIARATAIFFGLTAAAFLPMYVGAIFWKRMTKEGAIASLLIGSFSSILWLTLVHGKEATAIGICQALFGQPTLLTGTWTLIDPILVATPLSMLVAIVVSLLTKPAPKEHIEKCFGK